jgi:hypothetical protein
VKQIQKQQAGKQRRAAARRTRLLTWTVGLGVLGLVVYGISQMSGVAYTDRHILAVDFSDMTSSQKNAALREANLARCTCGCGMNLAQCVATDMTCPVRMSNIDKIKAMVVKARAAS